MHLVDCRSLNSLQCGLDCFLPCAGADAGCDVMFETGKLCSEGDWILAIVESGYLGSELEAVPAALFPCIMSCLSVSLGCFPIVRAWIAVGRRH